MDLLWGCEDMDKLNTLISALPTARDRVDAHSLVQIAIWESDEQQGLINDYEQEAKAVISRARCS